MAYEDNITIYIASIYWAVTTLATVGFGDITAYSDYERMFAVAWMVVGVGIYSFTIGSLTSILGNQDTRYIKKIIIKFIEKDIYQLNFCLWMNLEKILNFQRS